MSYVYVDITANRVERHHNGLQLAEISAPATPTSGYGHLYAKTDGKIYWKDDAGTEYDLTAAIGATGYVGTPVNLTARTAAIGATTAYTTPAADGYYRVNVTVTITQPATTSSQIGFQIKYTDANDSAVKTSNNVNNITQSTANTTGTMLAFSYPIYAKASTAIQYQTAYSSSGATAMQYDISIIIELIK